MAYEVIPSKIINNVAILLDRSGSMIGCREATVTGFNEQLQVLKQEGPDNEETNVSLITFNHEIEEKFMSTLASDVVELTNEDYVPDGTTALYDGIVHAVKRLRETTDESNLENAYLLVIMSDGMENCSSTPAPPVSSLINELKETGRWTFTYMGAISADQIEKLSANLGLDAGNVINYTASHAGTRSASVVMSDSLTSYKSARRSGMSQVMDFYSDGSEVASIPEDSTNLPDESEKS